MILDSIKHLDAYRGVIPIADEAKAFMERAGELSPGRYELEGGYVLVQEGETRPEESALYEAHNVYVDFQVVVSGSERLGWVEREGLPENAPYSQEKDIVFLVGGEGEDFEVKAGMFYVMFPGDAHKPCCHTVQQTSYRKYVFKFKA